MGETGVDRQELAGKSCTPCRGGVPPLTPEQARAYSVELPDWELVDGSTRLRRTYKFKTFREALDFVTQVGEIAEAEGHHPDVAFGWGYATLSLQTKKINGLHENDFIMAVKFDQLATA